MKLVPLAHAGEPGKLRIVAAHRGKVGIVAGLTTDSMRTRDRDVPLFVLDVPDVIAGEPFRDGFFDPESALAFLKDLGPSIRKFLKSSGSPDWSTGLFTLGAAGERGVVYIGACGFGAAGIVATVRMTFAAGTDQVKKVTLEVPAVIAGKSTDRKKRFDDPSGVIDFLLAKYRTGIELWLKARP